MLAADVVPGSVLESAIAGVFSDPAVTYLRVHNANRLFRREGRSHLNASRGM